jgi:hypothetical protein
VRSARTTDIAVFSPLDSPLYAWSGANTDFAEIIRNSALVDVGVDAHPEAYERRNESGHVAPHNLYSSTPQLFSFAPTNTPPPALFQFVKAGEAGSAAAKPVGSVHLEFGGGAGAAPVDYTWAPSVKGFTRDQKGSPDVDETGVQVAPQNVVVQFVNYHDTGYVDPSGAPVPEGDLIGSGDCWILTNGTLTEGTWTKRSNEAITTYADASGAPIKLTPGRTWVELVPIGQGTITG